MSVLMLSLIASIATAADGNGDGCEDSWFNANSACVATTASVGAGTSIGASATVGEHVSLGTDVQLGDSVFIGARSTVVGRVGAVGARVIGDGTVIGRRAYIDADHDIGTGNTFSRGIDIGQRLQTGPNVSLGYAVELGDDVSLNSGATLGSLVGVGNNTTVLASTIIARDAQIADSDVAATIGGIIGPEVTIGGDANIADTVRIRKQATLGERVTAYGGVRIGRDAVIADDAILGLNVRVGAGATVTATTSVPDGTVIPRGATYDDPAGESCVAPWLPVQGQGGVSDGIGTGTVFTQAGSAYNWNSVALSYNLSGDFEVVASWDADHIGIGAVHSLNTSYTAINGYSSAGTLGTYWGSLDVTGFPSGYSAVFKGHYAVNGTGEGVRYFRWSKSGSTLAIESTLAGVNGPWVHIPGSPWIIDANDQVVVGIGEGTGNNTNEGAPLRLLSCTLF